MKPFFAGIVVAAILPMIAIYLSDFFLFDIPRWATWPLMGLPLLGGAAIGVIDRVREDFYADRFGLHKRHV